MSFFNTIGAGSRARIRRIGLHAAIAAAACLAQPWLDAAEPVKDIRPVWVTSDRLESPDASRRLVSTALSGSFNTLFVPIPLDQDEPSTQFDRIDSLIKDARARGLRVHAWVQVSRASDAEVLPASRDNVIYRHPEWLMVPRELAVEMLDLDARGPDYVGRVARWARGSASARGLYISPLQIEAAGYLADAVKRIVTRYAVDGVHLDAVQFPGDNFDYSRQAMAAFRTEMRARLTAHERARMDAAEAIDPFGYAEEFPDDWRRFRVTRLTSLVARLRGAIKSVKPEAIVSASVTAGAEQALADHLQDWRTWFDNGFVDALTRPGSSSAALFFSYDTLIDPVPDPASTTAAALATGSP